MSTKNYNGSKFKGLRGKERKANVYRDKSVMPTKSVKPSKSMVCEGKLFINGHLFNNGLIGNYWTDYPSEATCSCGSKESKKVYYTQNKAYKMCLGCKADLGDASDS
jgi:hypothetical protein